VNEIPSISRVPPLFRPGISRPSTPWPVSQFCTSIWVTIAGENCFISAGVPLA
jgi:hypothetical protein